MPRVKVYTTKTGAKVLGYTQETLKWYAIKYGIGSQPGGRGTPYLFTRKDLLDLRGRLRQWQRTQDAEDKVELGLE